MKRYLGVIFSEKTPNLLFAGALLFTFFLHTLYFDHDHAKEAFGNDVQTAITHGGDKKYFFAFDIPISGTPPDIFRFNIFLISIFSLFSSACFLLRQSDKFREALRRGKIHPKLYA
jgi:hypothetical protein